SPGPARGGRLEPPRAALGDGSHARLVGRLSGPARSGRDRGRHHDGSRNRSRALGGSGRQAAARSIHRALVAPPPPVRRDDERGHGREEERSSPMRSEAFAKRAHRLAQVGICVQFLALVRTLAEFFRLEHVQGPTIAVATVAPYVGAALLAALFTWAGV